jgi:hypothetical protein
MLIGCNTVICGRHGPITKENTRFYSALSEDISVYLSPYEDIDENTVLPKAKLYSLQADDEGFVIEKFRFC